MGKSSIVLLLVLFLEAMLTKVGATTTDEDIIDRAKDCCHILMVTANPVSGEVGGWTFAAQMSSLYEVETGWDKYCDAFQITKLTSSAGEGEEEKEEVLTTRVLAHPHQTEQPFTRSTSTVFIDPLEVTDENFVLVASARDSVLGYCGGNVTIDFRSSLDTAATSEGGGQNQLTAIVATREPTQAPQPTATATLPPQGNSSGNETGTASPPSSSWFLSSSYSSCNVLAMIWSCVAVALDII